jgi:hypothetical protein
MNASKAQVCTSFVCGENDTSEFYGDIYLEMARYFNNTNVHKEWHKWMDGHDIWNNDNCITHPGETLLNMTLKWCNSHATILKNPSFEDRLRTVYGSAHWEANSQGWRELKGDFDSDGTCGPADYARLASIFGANVLINKTYDWRCDLNGDGVIGPADQALFSPDYGKTATRLDGAYSWYSNGGEYSTWQWLNGSASFIEGKQLNFSFNFRARDIYVNGTPIEARAEIYYQNETGEYWVNGTWFHPTSNATWYMLSVTANMPLGTTAVKVLIHGRPDFKAWIDLARVDISAS